MQDEYDQFGIYTIGKSVVPVTNLTSIQILNALELEDRTLSDISCEVDMPTSTVFFNLKGLIKKGLVKSYPDEINSKKVLYSMSSMRLIKSIPADDISDLIKHVISRMVSDESYFYRGWHVFAGLIELKFGLDISPAWNEAGRDIAKIFRGKIKSDNIEDLFEQIIKFAKEANLPGVSVFSFVPLVMILRMDYSIPKNVNNIFSSFIGFVEQVLEDNLHVRYDVASIETIGNEQRDLKISMDYIQSDYVRSV